MIQTLVTEKPPISLTNQIEFCRIISAAVINKRFCRDLLANPLKAISAGFNDEKFNLEKYQKEQLASIQAASLAEFATELA